MLYHGIVDAHGGLGLAYYLSSSTSYSSTVCFSASKRTPTFTTRRPSVR